MTVTETIPLPRDRIRQGLPFAVDVTDLTAWPGVHLRVNFQYNPHMNRFIWELEHVGYGRRIRRSVATLEYQYSIYPFMLAMFKDPADEAAAITPATLGDSVSLCVYPGPDGGSFLPAAGISPEEENEILDRGDNWRHPF